MLTEELQRAYRNTDYLVVAGDRQIAARIGQAEPAIDALLTAHDSRQGVFVVAWNPGSERRDDAANRAAHQQLVRVLAERRLAWLPHTGRGADGWHEEGCFVFGLDDAGARALALRFGQNAVVRIARGELSLAQLFGEDMLGDDLEEWLAESALMKRTFRSCAIIAGLIERRFPGEEKSRRQLTISTDLVYDVLRKHQPDHVLLRAARADAASGLLDIKRLGDMLSRIRGRIVHKALDHVSPLAVPALLEIGRETVYGEASDALLAEAADELIKEAMS